MNIFRRFAWFLSRRFPGFLRVASLLCAAAWFCPSASSQTLHRGEDPHGVISHIELKPPLRSASVAVHYSPDGRYLLVQDPNGIFVFSHEPLALRAHLSAEGAYPLEVSPDSATITVVGSGLTMTRAKLPLGEPLEVKDLPIHDGCLQALLSPGGEFFACLTPDFALIVYQLPSAQLVFSRSMQRNSSPYPTVFIPLDRNTAFSTPFGFRLSNHWDGMLGRAARFLSLFSSLDGKTLFAADALDSFRVDLPSGQKSTLSSAFRKQETATFAVLPEERVLVTGGAKDSGPLILSLKNGDVLSPPSFTADAARLSANPRYVLLSDAGTTGQRIFDLQQNRELEPPLNYSLDVFAEEAAAVDERGDLFLYRLGERLPFRSSTMPLDHLPDLRAAAVTPSLDEIALAVDGRGAVFSVATGQRLYAGYRFFSANFSDSSAAYLLAGATRKEKTHMLALRLPYARSTDAWSTSGSNVMLHASGPALLEYSFQNPLRSGIPTILIRGEENDIPYLLRGLDPATGKELWKREFSTGSPVPFSDPQGDRFVLAWPAKTESAQSEARHVHPAAEMFKHAKLSKLDTFFEVLDTRTGKALNGILVQQGSGPYAYDSAFSVGGVLFLMKDSKRLTIYSLQSGEQIARLVGATPSASAQSGLFAVEEGPGRLGIFDLTTAAKLEQHLFPEALAYTHFSADGTRLLALTAHQVAYLLDLANVRSAPPLPGPAPSN